MIAISILWSSLIPWNFILTVLLLLINHISTKVTYLESYLSISNIQTLSSFYIKCLVQCSKWFFVWNNLESLRWLGKINSPHHRTCDRNINIVYLIQADLNIQPLHNRLGIWKWLGFSSKYYGFFNIFQYCRIIKLEVLQCQQTTGIIPTLYGWYFIISNNVIQRVMKLIPEAILSNFQLKLLIDIVHAKIQDPSFHSIRWIPLPNFAKRAPFTTGLINLGNTCFMNSALQCMINNPSFQSYFTTISQMKGFKFDQVEYPLMSSTTLLLNKLANNHSSLNELRQFKRDMGVYEPIFAGYSQQDACEFLQHFLSRLHEEFQEYYSLHPHDHQLASIHSSSMDKSCIQKEVYRLNNSGFVNDLFQGFVRSTIQCEDCFHSEFTSLPLFYLTLNIPVFDLIQVNVSLIPFSTDGTQITTPIELIVPSNLIIYQIKQILYSMTGLGLKDILIVVETKSSGSLNQLRVIDDEKDSIEQWIQPNGKLICFEFPKFYSKDRFNYCFIAHQRYGRKKKCETIGEYMLGIIQKGMNYNVDSFYQIIAANIQRAISFPLNYVHFIECITLAHHQESEYDASLRLRKFIDKSLSQIGTNSKEEYCYIDKLFQIFKLDSKTKRKRESNQFIIDLTNESIFKHDLPIKTGDTLFIHWDLNLFQHLFLSDFNAGLNIRSNHSLNSFAKKIEIQPIYNSVLNVPLPNPKPKLPKYVYINEGIIKRSKPSKIPNFKQNKLTLQDCIEEYCKEQPLIPDKNPIFNWVCERCNGNYGKKYDEFDELPPYLIISLNRFKKNSCGYGGTKNDQLIRYSDTLTIKDTQSKSFTYRLYGVCNHFGSLTGGHYTAYCKNHFNNRWYSFNDTSVQQINFNQVINSNAYILFYQRDDSSNSNIPINFKEFKSTIIDYKLY